MKQGLNLLERVLQFYPLMREGDTAEVQLTEQDWLVLMDFSDNPATKELLPATIREMSVDRSRRTIVIETEDCKINVRMGM